MPLDIKNTEADKLARRLADVTGRSITDAGIYALREQLRREEGRGDLNDLAADLMDVGRHCAALLRRNSWVRRARSVVLLTDTSSVLRRSSTGARSGGIPGRHSGAQGAVRRTDVVMASVY